jgi:hypothetical protein
MIRLELVRARVAYIDAEGRITDFHAKRLRLGETHKAGVLVKL